jgi:hypothetical protein
MYQRTSAPNRGVDSETVQRFNATSTGNRAAHASSAAAAVSYTDATQWTEDWANLTAWSATNMQVSGNRLYCSGTTGATSAMRSIALGTSEKFHASTIMHWKAGGSAAFYFGVDTSATGTPATSSPTGAFIGFASNGGRSYYVGGSFGATAVDDAYAGANPTVDTSYHVTVDVDESFISFSARALGTTSDFHTIKIPRGTLALNYLNCYISDARFLTGHAFGPVVTIKSQQQPRTKTLASVNVEPMHRHLTTRSSSADQWRIQLPAGYDARIPAPVVIVAHQSLTGTADSFYAETRSQPVADALGNAGFIIATARDTGDRWGNSASVAGYLDLYKYVRSHFATANLFLLGLSMGSLSVLNALASTTWPTPAAVATICGVYNLDLLYAQSSYTAGIKTAYGVAADGSDYTTKTAGYNPATYNPARFRGVPFKLYAASDDTAVTPTGHTDALTATLGTTVPEATISYTTGGHLATSTFQAADLVAYYQKYV